MDVGGWALVVIAGPLILGAIIAYVISRNRRNAPDMRSPSYEEDQPGSGRSS
jgi:hypothetical protein